MAIEYRGEEILFAVEITDEVGEKLIRPFNQTGGSTSLSADEIELDTKDKTGSDYGKITQSVSLEGIITEGDEFIDHIKAAIRGKQFVKIYEINTRTKAAESGFYMISTFDREYSNGDFATYTLDGTLNGGITEEILTVVPDGAPLEGSQSEPEIP
ncbi:phage major tail protein, TP901-1 family [Bacillus sp. FSL K6-3431]|uniref:phage major tail protein, TP901-1 family n=1 Tax=Bacillus sp. FSL K6-3431 TaxID=2921500 RepID=UPI0030FB6977